MDLLGPGKTIENIYDRVLKVVDGSTPDNCRRVGPSYEKKAGARLSHCYQLEFMWHVIFGENDSLPLRVDDDRLPVALRLKDYSEDVRF